MTPPVPDTDIVAAVVNLVQGLSDTIFSSLTTILPIAGIVLVTMFAVGLLIRFFHRFARV